MKFYSTLFASACVLAIAAPASAQVSATLDGGYSRINAEHINLNDWNVNGAASYSLGVPGITLQANAGYTNLSGDSANINEWTGGGAFFWSGAEFRGGAASNYGGIGGDASGHLVNVGGFFEWFPGMFTVGVKGGGFSASGNEDGSYVGVEGAVYVMPNLSLSATFDYTNISDSVGFVNVGTRETDISPQAEWLVSDEIPVSVYAGYTYVNISSSASSAHVSGNGNIIFVGLRLYTNGTGATSLMDRQRSGTVGWAANFKPIGEAL
jgi:hypothetical protein